MITHYPGPDRAGSTACGLGRAGALRNWRISADHAAITCGRCRASFAYRRDFAVSADRAAAMRHNEDSMARLIGGAVKIGAGEAVAEADTFGRWGTFTLANGQVFRYEVTELDPEVVAAKAAERPGHLGGDS